MRFSPMLLLSSLLVAASAFQLPVHAQRAEAPAAQDAPSDQANDEAPTPAPLAVGSMAIASAAALSIAAMSVDVDVDKVTYTYGLKNNGASELSVAASVTEPDLEVNSDGTTVYELPSDKAENVVGLEVTANGQSVPTVSNIQALALGIDRRAELSRAKIPLIPFGQATDDALAGANREVLAGLESLGLLTPRDPAQPTAPVTADWSLRVVHGWTQKLPPNATTQVSVGFAPIKAVYTIDASNLDQFDTLKDETCLTPQLISGLKALLAPKGSTADVADLLIANDGPARWLETPPGHVVVHKPTPGSIVAFCGLDSKAHAAAAATGTLPSSNDVAAMRVLIFARAAAQ